MPAAFQGLVWGWIHLVRYCHGSQEQRAGRLCTLFYGWATSQNSKQRGRSLAPEPSREKRPQVADFCLPLDGI